MKVNAKDIVAIKKLALPVDPTINSIRRYIQRKDEFILSQLNIIDRALLEGNAQLAESKIKWLIEQIQSHQIRGVTAGHQTSPEDPYKGRDQARRLVEKVRMHLEDLTIRPMVQSSALGAPIAQLRRAEDILMKDRGTVRLMNEEEGKEEKPCGCPPWETCEECQGDTAVEEAEWKYQNR